MKRPAAATVDERSAEADARPMKRPATAVANEAPAPADARPVHADARPAAADLHEAPAPADPRPAPADARPTAADTDEAPALVDARTAVVGLIADLDDWMQPPASSYGKKSYVLTKWPGKPAHLAECNPSLQVLLALTTT